MENKTFNLLVVDDNEWNRDMLSRRLGRRGFVVHTAADGETALDIVAGEPVDLVLLDIMMPGLDGVEVLKILRREHSRSELPIIMATARASSQDVVTALDLGANDYVTKPLDFPVVLARVEAQLRTLAAARADRERARAGTATLGVGTVLAGKYRLDDKIGAGTFGAVYRARHLDLDHEVAVKVLMPGVTGTDDALERFRREGVAACRVRHPNAVTVLDFGATDGLAYLVMELLEGRTLVDELHARGRLPPARCLEILEPVCEVLASAHDAGLIHRDVKPENIFLHRSNHGEVVKVLDFGIAKLLGETITEENLTAEGWVLGTPAYMAPERVSTGTYDGRSDVYSLGVMLYEMLTGRRPFVTESNDPMALIMLHVSAEAPELRSLAPELPAACETVVSRAMSKTPDERPDARELAAALRRAIGGEDETTTVVTAVGSPPAPGSGEIDLEAPTISFAAEDRPGEGFLTRWLRRLRRTMTGERTAR